MNDMAVAASQLYSCVNFILGTCSSAALTCMTFSLSVTSLSVLFIIMMKCMDCHLDFPLIQESQCAKCASRVGKSNVEIKQLMVCGWSASCFLYCSDWLFIYFRLYHSAIPVGWSMLTSLHCCAMNVAIIIVRKIYFLAYTWLTSLCSLSHHIASWHACNPECLGAAGSQSAKFEPTWCHSSFRYAQTSI